MSSHTKRVLSRTGARVLTQEEIDNVYGSQGTGPACTFQQTHVGHAIDDLVDDCITN